MTWTRRSPPQLSCCSVFQVADQVRVRVWCEDRAHEVFVRRLLEERFRVHRKAIHFNVAPKGHGSAAKWVLDQYPGIRGEARVKTSQGRLGFLVVVDGDVEGVSVRMKHLHPGPHQDDRASGDRIAILVPTWSIETWVLWLSGRTVNETQSHKTTLDPDGFRDLVPKAISAWESPRDDEIRFVPSLAAARKELARLPASG